MVDKNLITSELDFINNDVYIALGYDKIAGTFKRFLSRYYLPAVEHFIEFYEEYEQGYEPTIIDYMTETFEHAVQHGGIEVLYLHKRIGESQLRRL